MEQVYFLRNWTIYVINFVIFIRGFYFVEIFASFTLVNCFLPTCVNLTYQQFLLHGTMKNQQQAVITDTEQEGKRVRFNNETFGQLFININVE